MLARVAVRFGVAVAVGGTINVAVGSGLGVTVGVFVTVGVARGVTVGRAVGVAVGSSVAVAVTVGTKVAVKVGLGVAVAVGDAGGVGVLVGLGVKVGATVALGGAVKEGSGSVTATDAIGAVGGGSVGVAEMPMVGVSELAKASALVWLVAVAGSAVTVGVFVPPLAPLARAGAGVAMVRTLAGVSPGHQLGNGSRRMLVMKRRAMIATMSVGISQSSALPWRCFRLPPSKFGWART